MKLTTVFLMIFAVGLFLLIPSLPSFITELEKTILYFLIVGVIFVAFAISLKG